MTPCEDYRFSRRQLLAGAAALATAGVVGMPRLAFGAGGSDLLVVVTLRGGADGLSLVPPVGDRAYAAARPGIAVGARDALRLDRTFGLHPGLKPLLPYWTDRRLAVVHAVGDADGTRSHFEATDAQERGVRVGNRETTGWVDRLLRARGQSADSLPALAIAGRTPGYLVGPAADLATNDVRGLRLRVGAKEEAAAARALADMHRGVKGPMADSARQTLKALGQFARFRDATYVPRSGVTYADDQLSRGLRQVAQVARAGIGLEVACLDLGGWDTHEGMGGATGGYMAGRVAALGAALASFARDLGPLLDRTVIVTQSEFGRRLEQNASGGVDHGHGSATLVLGGGIRGGRVYGRWPGLGKAQLDNGDLRVTTDYRDVLGELVVRRLGTSEVGTVFPEFRPAFLGLARQR